MSFAYRTAGYFPQKTGGAPPAGDKVLRVLLSGVWTKAVPYVLVSGVWTKAVPHVLQSGAWAETNETE